MDSPFLWGGELYDELFFNEEIDDLFAQVSCRVRSYGRSFPFDLDGDIFDGLLGHS